MEAVRKGRAGWEESVTRCESRMCPEERVLTVAKVSSVQETQEALPLPTS